MSSLKFIRKKIEIVLTHVACWLIAPLSRRAVLALAHVIGTLGYHFSGRLKAVGRANLDLVFGDRMSPQEKLRILKASSRTFALVTLDMAWFSRNIAARVNTFTTFEREPGEVIGGKPYICITGHFGNWEVLGLAAALRGYPLASVATPLKNPVVDQLFRRQREATGQVILDRAGAVRSMLRTLKSGGRVALLLDQNTQINEGGVFVDFFGVPATVSAAGASLAYRTGTGIAFGFSIPDADGRYHIHIPPAITPLPYRKENADQAILELTQQITRVYEDMIRAHPECWLWMYKRWKHVMPGDARERYPFYTSELRPDLIPPSYRNGET